MSGPLSWMRSRTRDGAAVYGIDANIIEVEVDVSGVKMSEDHFHTVGLPDAAVRESRDRVRSALKNCGYDIPPTQITINLAPADIRKEGSGFDLPMALGILGAYGGLNPKQIVDCLFVGELSLDGGVRGVRADWVILPGAPARIGLPDGSGRSPNISPTPIPGGQGLPASQPARSSQDCSKASCRARVFSTRSPPPAARSRERTPG